MSVGILILVLAMIPALWKRSGLFSIIWFLGSALLAYEYMEVLYSRVLQDYLLSMPAPLGEIHIGLDKLSAFFGVIFSIGLPIGMLYGHFYLREHDGDAIRSHLFWLGIMGLSLHCLLWVRHSLVFLMLWEIMSLSSFFCVIFSKKENLRPGLNYLITMQVGAAFLIAGFAMAYLESGTFNFSGFEDMNPIPMYLILIGFAFKAGVFPFASWLPQAHPVAPSHVSGIMSSLLVKTGFYGILVIVSANRFSLREIGAMGMIFAISAFWAVTHLLNERNLKRALAFSTVENVGIAGLGLCMGLLGLHAHLPNMALLGFTGALLHVFFHSIFKAQLFYNSGNVLLASGTADIDEMGGLAKTMPYTAVLTLVGIMAISAIPLTNGFLSEFYIFKAALEASDAVLLTHLFPSLLILSALAFISALAMIAFFRLYAILFLGTPRTPSAERTKELSFGLRLPAMILSFGILLTGIFPNIPLRFVKPLLRWFDLDINLFAELGTLGWKLSLIYLILSGLFLMIYLLRNLCVKEKLGNTWACGYPKVNSRMQSTSITFVQPLAYFLKPFMIQKSRLIKSIGPFPDTLDYREEHPDQVWELVVRPLTRLLTRFLAMFSGIHNGKTNSYIAWALAFLVVLLIRVVLFK